MCWNDGRWGSVCGASCGRGGCFRPFHLAACQGRRWQEGGGCDCGAGGYRHGKRAERPSGRALGEGGIFRGAAGGVAAPADAGRGDRAAASAGAGPAAAAGVRVGAAAFDDPVGATRGWQDDAGAADGTRVRTCVHRTVGGVLGGEGHPGGHGGGAAQSGRGAPHHSVHRRDSPLQQGTAGCAAAVCRVGADHADRRNDGESVVRGEFGAAVAGAGVCAAVAVG